MLRGRKGRGPKFKNHWDTGCFRHFGKTNSPFKEISVTPA